MPTTGPMAVHAVVQPSAAQIDPTESCSVACCAVKAIKCCSPWQWKDKTGEHCPLCLPTELTPINNTPDLHPTYMINATAWISWWILVSLSVLLHTSQQPLLVLFNWNRLTTYVIGRRHLCLWVLWLQGSSQLLEQEAYSSNKLFFIDDWLLSENSSIFSLL